MGQKRKSGPAPRYPLYLEQPTSAKRPIRSANANTEDGPHLIYDLVGDCQQLRWNFDEQRLGCPPCWDHQLEFGRLGMTGRLARLFALENFKS